jgi:hypothetical protein
MKDEIEWVGLDKGDSRQVKEKPNKMLTRRCRIGPRGARRAA